jgi:hypothetical protein
MNSEVRTEFYNVTDAVSAEVQKLRQAVAVLPDVSKLPHVVAVFEDKVQAAKLQKTGEMNKC